MMLIADSGSTKTDYRYIRANGAISQYESEGLNPYFHTVESSVLILEKTFSKINKNEVEQIYFYGAGCSSGKRKAIIQQAFLQLFKNADIHIEHDLLGSSRAACGNVAGLAGILGTGSNCCVFDGEKILKEFPSTGYVLGDEGGGVFLGKLLIKALLENKLPNDLRTMFGQRYKMNNEDILHAIYKEAQPNKFLASFAKFIFHHRDHAFIIELIHQNFQEYFDVQVKSFEEYKLYPLNLVGSIAFYFQEFIRTIAAKEGIQVGTILEKPIAGLTLYHHPF